MGVRQIVSSIVQRQVKRNLWGQGMSRHSREDMIRLAGRMMKSLADIMGDNTYLMGKAPCGADATVFSFVANSLCPLFDSELLTVTRSHANLVAYNERMMKEFYPDLAKA